MDIETVKILDMTPTIPNIRRFIKTFKTIEVAAVYVGVHSNTMRRWASGVRSPSNLAEEKLLRAMEKRNKEVEFLTSR